MAKTFLRIKTDTLVVVHTRSLNIIWCNTKIYQFKIWIHISNVADGTKAMKEKYNTTFMKKKQPIKAERKIIMSDKSIRNKNAEPEYASQKITAVHTGRK